MEGRDGVAKILVEQYHVSPPIPVDCPPDQEAKPGNAFICVAKIGGEDKAVDIKVLDDKGTYEVGTPHDK